MQTLHATRPLADCLQCIQQVFDWLPEGRYPLTGACFSLWKFKIIILVAKGQAIVFMKGSFFFAL